MSEVITLITLLVVVAHFAMTISFLNYCFSRILDKLDRIEKSLGKEGE